MNTHSTEGLQLQDKSIYSGCQFQTGTGGHRAQLQRGWKRDRKSRPARPLSDLEEYMICALQLHFCACILGVHNRLTLLQNSHTAHVALSLTPA